MAIQSQPSHNIGFNSPLGIVNVIKNRFNKPIFCFFFSLWVSPKASNSGCFFLITFDKWFIFCLGIFKKKNVRKKSYEYHDSITFAFPWKQGIRRILQVPLFVERNGQKCFFSGTSGICRIICVPKECTLSM